MSHSTLVTLHALGGLLALVAGGLALRRPSYLDTYFWSLVACIAFLVAVVAVDWNGLDTGSRALFTASARSARSWCGAEHGRDGSPLRAASSRQPANLTTSASRSSRCSTRSSSSPPWTSVRPAGSWPSWRSPSRQWDTFGSPDSRRGWCRDPANRPRHDEPRGGGAPVHQRGDGEDAPTAHLRQARRQRPCRRGGRGLRARPTHAAPGLKRRSGGQGGMRGPPRCHSCARHGGAVISWLERLGTRGLPRSVEAGDGGTGGPVAVAEPRDAFPPRRRACVRGRSYDDGGGRSGPAATPP
jgi:hypothetical protein